MTVSSRPIKVFIALCMQVNLNQTYIPLPDGLRLQVLEAMADLPRCQKHQFAAFIKEQGILVVWGDDPKTMIRRADELVQGFMAVVWNFGGNDDDEENEKGGPMDARADLEEQGPEERQTAVLSSFIVAIALAILISCSGLGARKLALEITVDGNYMRLALLASLPLIFIVGLVSLLKKKNPNHILMLKTVRLHILGQQRLPDHRARLPSQSEHQELLWKAAPTIEPGKACPATRHHPDASI
jgi:hypothetical protein